MQNNKRPSLFLCLVMDILGYATYAIPVLGELGDIVWAPLSAIVFYNSFGRNIRTTGSIINFVEELFPGLDFIPTFTLAYFLFPPVAEKSRALPSRQGRENS
jgi:hypothetical protein